MNQHSGCYDFVVAKIYYSLAIVLAMLITGQKMVLNMLSTGAMIKLGKVYENLMIDVESTNIKLKERCKKIVMEATSVDECEAKKYLEIADYDVKLSIFMIKTGLDKLKSKDILDKHKGYVRKALESVKNK